MGGRSFALGSTPHRVDIAENAGTRPVVVIMLRASEPICFLPRFTERRDGCATTAGLSNASLPDSRSAAG